MALLSFGATAGLAYRHNWEAEMQRQAFNEQADRQAKLDAENKAMMLGDKLQFAHASNTWDNKLLKEFSENRIKEIGKFATENPNFMNDAGLWAQFNQMSDELTNNDIVSRSLRVQQNYDSLVGYLQQNPGAENDPAVQQQLTEYDNYIKFGSVDGVTQNGKEFMFRNPDEQFDPLARTAEAFSQLAAVEDYDTSGVGVGATKTEVPKEAQYSTAVGLWNGPDGWRYQNAWKSMSDTDKSYYQNDPIQWIMGMGKAYTASSVNAGTVFAPRSGGGSGSGSGSGGGMYSPYYNDFGRLQAGGGSIYSPNVGALLPIQDGSMFVDNPLQVKVIDKDGKESWRTLTSYNNTKVDAQPTGNVGVNPAGQAIAEVRVRVPVTEELAWGDDPLLNSTEWGWYSDATDVEDNPAYSGVAKVETDENGDKTGYAWVKTWVPTSSDPAAIRNYDVAASGQSNANKAEGLALSNMTQSAIASQALAIGGSGVWTTDDGQYVTRKSDGKYYYIATGEEYK